MITPPAVFETEAWRGRGVLTVVSGAAVAGVRVVSSYVCSVKSSVMVGPNGKKDAKAMVEVRTSGESNGFFKEMRRK